MSAGNLGNLEWSVRARIDLLDADLRGAEARLERFRTNAERPVNISARAAAGGGGPGAQAREQSRREDAQSTRAYNAIEKALTGDPRESRAMRQLAGLLPPTPQGDRASTDSPEPAGLAGLTKGVNRFATLFAIRAIHQAIQTAGENEQLEIKSQFAGDEESRIKVAQAQVQRDIAQNLIEGVAFIGDSISEKLGSNLRATPSLSSYQLAEAQKSLDTEKYRDEQNKIARKFTADTLSVGLTGAQRAIADIAASNAESVYEAKVEQRDILADTSLSPIEQEGKLATLSGRLNAQQKFNIAETQQQFYELDKQLGTKQAETQANEIIASGGSPRAAQRVILQEQNDQQVQDARRQLNIATSQNRDSPASSVARSAYQVALDNSQAKLDAFDAQWTVETLARSYTLKGQLDVAWQTLLRNPLGAQVTGLRAQRDAALLNPDLTPEQRVSTVIGEQVQEQLALRNQQDQRSFQGAELQGAIQVNELRAAYKDKSAQARQIRLQAEQRAEAFRRSGDSGNAKLSLEEGQSEEDALSAQFKAENIGSVRGSYGYYGGPGFKGKRQFYEAPSAGIQSAQSEKATLGGDISGYNPGTPVGGSGGLYGGDLSTQVGSIVGLLQQFLGVLTGGGNAG